jgi:hypothetical protein
MPAGDYKLELSGHGMVAAQQITVVADAAVHARFELPPEPIALVVEYAQCKGITLRSMPAEDWLTNSTCKDGAATFEDITPGTYEVCVEYSTCAPVTVTAAPQRQIARPTFAVSEQPAVE